MVNYPTSLDDFVNPTPANNLNTPAVLHSTQHSNLNDAVEALQAKVGINSSAVATSLDYKINHLSVGNFTSSNISQWTNDSGYLTSTTALTWLGTTSTTFLPEGATNLYFTDERAQDAIGVMVDTTLVYVDGTPLLTRAALTGDVTSPQASNAMTLATVNTNVGTFGSSTAIPISVVNGKGLITGITTAAVIAPAGTLTGTTLAANVVTSSLTTIGTLVAGAVPFSLVTGTVPVTQGGTFITSYAIGDLLYASGATTLSKLADVATGNALISGGVTTAPSWGKIGLTTHISGTFASGGIPYCNSTSTLASSALLDSGGVVYGGGAGASPATDSLFIFDATNKRLSVGIGSNGYAGNFGSTSNTTDGISVRAQNNPEVKFYKGSTSRSTVGVAGTANDYFTGTSLNSLVLYGLAGNVFIGSGNALAAMFDGSQNTALGGTTASDRLHVYGNTRVDNSTSGKYSIYNGATLLSSIGQSSTTTMQIINAQNGSMEFHTNNTSKMTLTAGGILYITSGGTQDLIIGGTGGSDYNLLIGKNAGNYYQINAYQQSVGGKDLYIQNFGASTSIGQAIATNATEGHLRIPTCAGAPTGTPALGTGSLVFDTTNKRLYGYAGGAWNIV